MAGILMVGIISRMRGRDLWRDAMKEGSDNKVTDLTPRPPNLAGRLACLHAWVLISTLVTFARVSLTMVSIFISSPDRVNMGAERRR